MAQRYITSGRRYKEPQGLAPINPYYAKRILERVEPTLNNIATGKAATLDAISDYSGDGGDTLGGVDTSSSSFTPVETRAAELSGYGTPMGALGRGVNVGKSMAQAAALSPFGVLGLAPFGIETFATPIAEAYNTSRTAQQLSDLQYGFDPPPNTQRAIDIAMVENEARQASKNPISTALSNALKGASKSDIPGYGRMSGYELSKAVDLSMSDPFGFSRNVRGSFGSGGIDPEQSNVEGFAEGLSATTPIGMMGMLGEGIIGQPNSQGMGGGFGGIGGTGVGEGGDEGSSSGTSPSPGGDNGGGGFGDSGDGVGW